MTEITEVGDDARGWFALGGGHFTAEEQEERGEAFDRWLAEVRAQAWHEGWMHDADYLNTWGQFCPHESCNPYRAEKS